MQMTITKVQKGCMFIGAAVFGSLCLMSVLWESLKAESSRTLASHHWTFYVGGGFAVLCYLVFAMVFGAWLGGILSLIWRSPPGQRWFWTLSGGNLGGIFALALVMFLIIMRESPPSRGQLLFDMILFGGIFLMLTLTGLLIGNLVGRRWQRNAELAAYSSMQDES